MYLLMSRLISEESSERRSSLYMGSRLECLVTFTMWLRPVIYPDSTIVWLHIVFKLLFILTESTKSYEDYAYQNRKLIECDEYHELSENFIWNKDEANFVEVNISADVSLKDMLNVYLQKVWFFFFLNNSDHIKWFLHHHEIHVAFLKISCILLNISSLNTNTVLIIVKLLILIFLSSLMWMIFSELYDLKHFLWT